MKLIIEIEEIGKYIIIRVNDESIILSAKISTEEIKRNINLLLDKCE